ncbi:MAG: hypothetical protein ACRDZ3_15235 [Acidimicrobiia bacterium]
MQVPSVPQLRPLSVGEILDVSLKIWLRHFVVLAKIVLFVVAPVQIVASLLLASAIPDSDLFFDPSAFDTSAETVEDPFADFDGGDAAAVFAAFGVVTILSGLAFVFSSAAALRAVTVAYLGGAPDWRDSLRLALNRVGPLLALSILMGLGMTLGFVLCLAPGVWLAVGWSLAFVALLAEDIGATDSLRRSWRLVKGRWWATFGVLLIAFLLNVVVDQIVSIPFAIGSIFSPNSVIGFGLSAVAAIISDVITTPFVAAVFVLVYFDLRVRKEGFDLALLAQAMGPLPEGGPAYGNPYHPPPGGYGPTPGPGGYGPGPTLGDYGPPPASWAPPPSDQPPSDEPPSDEPPSDPAPPSEWPPPGPSS